MNKGSNLIKYAPKQLCSLESDCNSFTMTGLNVNECVKFNSEMPAVGCDKTWLKTHDKSELVLLF